jgi:hypothetical protein
VQGLWAATTSCPPGHARSESGSSRGVEPGDELPSAPTLLVADPASVADSHAMADPEALAGLVWHVRAQRDYSLD